MKHKQTRKVYGGKLLMSFLSVVSKSLVDVVVGGAHMCEGKEPSLE